MPKSIRAQTRIADLGEPRIIVVDSGFGALEVIKSLNVRGKVVLLDLLYKTRESMAAVGREQ